MTTASSRHVPTRRRAAFTPRVRGDLGQALVAPETFLGVAPAVPRSVAWLRDRTIARSERVTARDHALFEALMAMATIGQETDLSVQAARLCSVDRALTVMSAGGHAAQPRELVAALERLFGRKPEPLKKGGMFGVHIPAWAVPLQQPGTRYSHVDLAVMARFRRRSSPLLYKDVLAHIAAERIRYEPGQPPFILSYVPSQLAEVLGMPSPPEPEPLHVGQLRLRYLDPAVAELGEHVRAFEIVSVADSHEPRRRRGQLVRDEAGGTVGARAVSAITLTIRMLPPDRLETVPTRLLSEGDFDFLVKRRDAAPYAVKAATLVRLGATLPSRIMRRRKDGGAYPLLASEMHAVYDCWLAAIHEALTGTAITPGYETAPLRGRRLLDAIVCDGADRTFWAFAHAEAAAPDIGPATEADIPYRVAVEAARRARLKEARSAKAKERRTELRLARGDGMMPPAEKRANPKTMPEPAKPVAAPGPRTAPPQVPAELVATLSTPEGRAEGARLFREWQSAFEFPFLHAAKTAERIRAAFERGDFPILAAVDAASGLYLGSLNPIANLTRETTWGVGAREREENASHYVAILARSWPTRVSNGRSVDPVAEILGDREIWKRDRARAKDRMVQAEEALRAKLAGTAPKPVVERFRDGFVPKRAVAL